MFEIVFVKNWSGEGRKGLIHRGVTLGRNGGGAVNQLSY